MLRVLRWLLSGLLGLLVVGFAVLMIGARVGLDGERRHSAHTAALPVASPSSDDGLVRVRAGEFEFRARVAGLSNTGPPLILLHGFPETSAMWKSLLQEAASLGYRVVAFDQRGYSPGARPQNVEDYLIPKLVRDVIDVADAFGFERFHLVGHDWGAVVGWSTVGQHPDRIRSWTALSIPHSGVFVKAMERDLPAYIDVFNLRFLADAVFTFNGLALLDRTVFSALPEGDEYLAVLSEPGALSAAIHWYRALRPSIPAAADIPLEIDLPVLFIGGDQDYWPNRPERAQQAAFMKGPFTELDLDAGHYLMAEQPDVVIEAVIAHLGRVDAGPAPGP
ncbi:MAG: alpha/beta hydrolase [bacterium]|nr:alpha/beta hydrolase [bacterium]